MKTATIIKSAVVAVGLLLGNAVGVLEQADGAATQAAEVGNLIGVRNFLHTVTDLDKTVAFYRNVLGMQLAGPLQKPNANPAVQKLCDVPGAKLRAAFFKLPGESYGFELMEFTDIDRKPAPARFSEPGAASLVVLVRNVDPVYEALQKAGAAIIGAPAPSGGGSGKGRSVFVRDPDGFLVEINQPGPTSQTDGPTDSNVLGARIRLTIDTNKTLAFYRDVLGFRMAPEDSFMLNKAAVNTLGIKSAHVRVFGANSPGALAKWEFYEFKGVDHKPASMGFQDIGTAAVTLWVRNMDDLMARAKAAGAPFLSKPVAMEGNPAVPPTLNVFVRDPSGFLVEFIEKK